MKLGFREGLLHDETRPDWDASGPRPIRWSLWYPAADGSLETEFRAAAGSRGPRLPATHLFSRR